MKKINENKIDKNIAKLNSKVLSGKSFKLKKLAPVNAGIDKKKRNFCFASTLLKFENLQPVIIIPDLLTPGIIDNA